MIYDVYNNGNLSQCTRSWLQLVLPTIFTFGCPTSMKSFKEILQYEIFITTPFQFRTSLQLMFQHWIQEVHQTVSGVKVSNLPLNF